MVLEKNKSEKTKGKATFSEKHQTRFYLIAFDLLSPKHNTLQMPFAFRLKNSFRHSDASFTIFSPNRLHFGLCICVAECKLTSRQSLFGHTRGFNDFHNAHRIMLPNGDLIMRLFAQRAADNHRHNIGLSCIYSWRVRWAKGKLKLTRLAHGGHRRTRGVC